MISAFVITAGDRPEYLLKACLKRVRFVDELILVDKSRNGIKSNYVLGGFVDRYARAQWTPVVEDTRAFAQSLCSHDWIICLDDDEILSPGAGDIIRSKLPTTEADVCFIPIRNYILGRYEPKVGGGESRPCLYRRCFVEYPPVVHAGAICRPGAELRRMGDDVWIDHLSHPDISAWLEKTNRYTNMAARTGQDIPRSVGRWALETFDRRLGPVDTEAYPEAVAALRAMYDIADGLKRWEETQPNGHEAFRKFCEEIAKE